MAQACDPRHPGAGAGALEGQGLSELQSDLKPSLGSLARFLQFEVTGVARGYTSVRKSSPSKHKPLDSILSTAQTSNSLITSSQPNDNSSNSNKAAQNTVKEEILECNLSPSSLDVRQMSIKWGN